MGFLIDIDTIDSGLQSYIMVGASFFFVEPHIQHSCAVCDGNPVFWGYRSRHYRPRRSLLCIPVVVFRIIAMVVYTGYV